MPLDPDDERLMDELQAAHTRRRITQMTVAPNAAQAAPIIAANHRAYPHLKAGDVWALSQGGHGPDSLVTQVAATQRAKHKVKRGFGWASIGDAVKGTSRVAFTAFSAPLEELQGVIRGAGWGGAHTRTNEIDEGAGDYLSNVGHGIAAAGRSTGFKAVEDLVAGRRVDLGSGFFPAGKLAEERRRDSERLQIYGQPITTGRVVAHRVAEQGTKPYTAVSGLIDFSVALTADPVNLAGVKFAEARKARKLFVSVDEPTALRRLGERAGLIDARRRTVDTDRVAQWLDSPDGRDVVEGIAAEADFDTLWRRLGKKVDVSDVLELSRRNTPEAVRDHLAPLLGVQLREKPTLARLPQNPVIRRIRDARLFQGMPGDSIDFDDPNKAVETVDRWLRNAGIRDSAVIGRHTKAIAEATTAAASGGDRFEAVTGAARVVEEAMLAHGVPATRARELTRLFRDSQEELRRFNVDAIGSNSWFPGVKVGADNLPAASPHLIVEALNSKVMLPDAREVRELTSRFRNVLEMTKLPRLTLEHLQSLIWRPAVLLRPAYIGRVLGEEALRQAGAGFDSFANHPLSALATMVADDGRLGRLLNKVPGADAGKAQVDVYGEVFRTAAKRAPKPTAYEQALYQGRVAEPVGRARTVTTRHKIVYDKSQPEYAGSWADEIMQIRADPIGERVALGGLKAGDRTPNPADGIDGIKDWFFEGTGRGLRDDVADMGIDVSARPQADAYIDSVVDRLRTKTGGNPELMDAAATGVFRGVPIRLGNKINPKFVKALEEVIDLGPTRVKGDLTVAGRGASSELRERYDRVLNMAFEAIMVKPANFASRSPVFRQAYWRRMSELAPFMDDAARATMLKGAADAEMDAKWFSMTRQRIAEASKPGRLSMEEADLVSKGYGLETTRDLLYDIGDKGQLADQLRLAVPFAEAFKEQITRWSKIIVQNPRVLRRAQQSVEGARGAGWFQQDPTSGEEIFSYPGTKFMTERLLNVPVPLTGRVQGLSMAGNLLPGFGPVVQIPAAAIIPNKPEADWVRGVFLPFGEPDMDEGIAESFLPPWAKRFHTALLENDPETDRLFGNTVFDLAAYMVSNGDHTVDSPEAEARLLAEATTKAKALFMLRGLAQGFAPSAPSPQFLARDADGDLMVARQLVQEYAEMQDEDYETATERFLDKFGENALLYMQPKSRGGARPTDVLDRWTRQHPEVREKYRTVYGFFGPQGGEFSSEFYGRQIRSGERETLSPAAAIRSGEHRVASMAYRQAKAQVEGRTDTAARQWLAQVREELVRAYPGYEPMPKDLGKTDRTIRELARAAKDPLLAGTDAGQGIVAYLAAREMAVTAAKNDLGLTSGFGKAKRARYLRDYLRGVAAEITAENPDFAEVWDYVLSREMVDDEPEIGEAA